MKLNEKLKQRLIEWDSKEMGKRYDSDSLSEILEYNLEYRKSGNYPYNRSIVDFILEKENIDSNLLDYLKTEVYLSQQQIDRIEKQKRNDEMIGSGFLPLTKEIVTEAKTKNKKIHIVGQHTNDWMTIKTDNVYKPFINESGDCFLMKPKARSRGYSIYHFEEAFCKIV